eukprot:gene12278-15425_t
MVSVSLLVVSCSLASRVDCQPGFHCVGGGRAQQSSGISSPNLNGMMPPNSTRPVRIRKWLSNWFAQAVLFDQPRRVNGVLILGFRLHPNSFRLRSGGTDTRVQGPSPPVDGAIFTTQSNRLPSPDNSFSEASVSEVSVSEVPVLKSELCALEKSPLYLSMGKALFLPLDIVRGSVKFAMFKTKGSSPKSPAVGNMPHFEVMLKGARESARSRGSRNSSLYRTRFTSQHNLFKTEHSTDGEKTEQRTALGRSLYSHRSNKSCSVTNLQAQDQTSGPLPMMKTKRSGRSLRLPEQSLKAESNNQSSLHDRVGCLPDADSSTSTSPVHGMSGRENPTQINCRPIQAVRSCLRFVSLPSHHEISPVNEEPHVPRAGCSPASPASPAPPTSKVKSMPPVNNSGDHELFPAKDVGIMPSVNYSIEHKLSPAKEHVAKAGGGQVEGAHAGTGSSVLPSELTEKLMHASRGIPSELTEKLVDPSRGLPSQLTEKPVDPSRGLPSQITEEGLVKVGERMVGGQPQKEKKSLSLMAKINRKLTKILSKGTCVWPG